MTISDKKQLTLKVHERLFKVYEKYIDYKHNYDPISELVSSLLSHRTTNRNERQAFDNLLRVFHSWDGVKDAPVHAIANAIQPCTWPEQKAPRLKAALQLIVEKTGKLSLDFLKDMEADVARKWLEQLPGVGPKSSAAVLSYSTLKMRALPVDSHHFRVATRLGMIDPKIGETKANKVLEDLLPPDFNAEQVFENHQVMMFHGQKVCFYNAPDCKKCVLLDICPAGQKFLI